MNYDWQKIRLKEIGSVCMCKRILKYQTNTEKGIPFYKIGTFGKKADAFISEELYKKYKDKYNYPEKGDILISAAGTLGETIVYDGKPAYFQDSNIVWLKHDSSKAINKFLLYVYAMKPWEVPESSTVPRLYNNNILNTYILLPPLPEQEKIAEILGAWDLAIEKLTALIEQKKLLKKGLMQRLLTGKQRLPGFSTPWNKVKLKNICDISKGEQLGRLEMTETGVYPVINGGISKSGLTDSYNREKDTITISEGGNSCGFVAFMKERFWCGGHCYALSNLQTNLHFLFQILKSKESDIMKLRVGSGLPNIQKSSLDAFSLHIPTDISEQKAIANILSKADEEITLLTRKLSALKSQKKGLMQKLLTGQIRVKGA